MIRGPNSVQVPSHIFYADDVLILCKGSLANLRSQVFVFESYAKVSGQVLNCGKSFIYGGAMSQSRLNMLSLLTEFKVGISPVFYLGIPLFKGKPCGKFLLPIADKIILKLASWKGPLISFTSKVELVKSPIQSMLIHSMSLYFWPVSLLRNIERADRNFIWSGDVYKPLLEGGLGIRSLFDLNAATNLKLAWDFVSSKDPWAILIKNLVMRKNNYINYHIHSSIWSSVKVEILTIYDTSSWLLGNDDSI